MAFPRKRKLRFDKDSELNLELEKDGRAQPTANPGTGTKKPKKTGTDYGSFD